ncbi:hypothetical protein ACFOWZ_36330 [Lentzea rhizosphaerae]|uniref:Uncharacterized protein n=1 Tax=Lentzea rhizosphaerae TaxID=2041025 RepID=A0ABV8C507_9PSEU
MRSRVLVYFGSLLATVALINTPVPRIIVSAVLNPEAGDAVARSLGSITKDLVLVLLISIYFEWVRTREQSDLLRGLDGKLEGIRENISNATAPAVRRLVLDSATSEELVTTALDRDIPHTPHKASLVSLMLQPRPVLRDVSMALRIEGVDETAVHAGIRIEVTMPRGQMLVAATPSVMHSTALSAACPDVFEVVSLGRPGSFDEAARTFGEKLECYVESPSRTTRRVEFRRVPANALRKYISPPVGMTAGDIVLFAADLGEGDGEFVRVRYHYHWSQDLDEHFVYWAADRPMFVRTITLDMRELVTRQDCRVWVKTFLGGVDSLVLDNTSDGHTSLSLDRWIVEGQGVVAVW